MREKLSDKKVIVATAAAIAAVLLCSFVFVFAFKNENGTYRSIKIVETDGTVSIERGQKDQLQASANMNLQSGDRISTDRNSFAVLCLDEDKFVRLNADSTITVEAAGKENSSKTKIILEKGGVLNEIQNPLEENSSYDIKTPNATMSVRGTVYEVRLEEIEDEDCTSVLVYDGKVEVAVDGLDSDIYKKGEYTQFTNTDNPEFIIKKSEITLDVMDEQILQWLDDISETGRETILDDIFNNSKNNDNMVSSDSLKEASGNLNMPEESASPSVSGAAETNKPQLSSNESSKNKNRPKSTASSDNSSNDMSKDADSADKSDFPIEKNEPNMTSDTPDKTEHPDRIDDFEKTAVPMVTQETKKTDAPKVTENIKKTDKPKSTQNVNKTDKPKVTENVKNTDLPKKTAEINVTETPKATEGIYKTEPPKKTEDAVKTEPPKKTENAVKTEPPKKTLEAVKTEPPKKTEDTVKTEPPKKTENAVETAPPKGTADPDKTELPDETDVPIETAEPEKTPDFSNPSDNDKPHKDYTVTYYIPKIAETYYENAGDKYEHANIKDVKADIYLVHKVSANTLLAVPPVPECSDKKLKFEGWYCEDGTRFDYSERVNRDINLYPVWVNEDGKKYYPVIMRSKEMGLELIASVKEGTLVYETPERSGYKLVGWEKSDGSLWGNVTEKVDGVEVLNAVWENRISLLCKVVFQTPAGDIVDVAQVVFATNCSGPKRPISDGVELPDGVNEKTKVSDWVHKGVSYKDKKITSNITFIAVWEENYNE